MGAARAIALCQCFSGALEYQAGHWHAAEAMLNDSINLYREMGAASGEAIALQRLGALQTARGQIEQAMISFNEGLIAAERAVMRAHCQTRLYTSMTRNRLLAGDLPAAEQYLSLGLEMSGRHGNCATCDALLLPAAVTVRIQQGKISQAELFCQKLEHAAEHYGSSIWVAMARQSRAEVCAAENKPEQALQKYQEAYEAYKAAGHDYEAARCLLSMADLQFSHGTLKDVQRAADFRREAQELLNHLETN